MKKRIFILLGVLLILLAPTLLFAQNVTWINPFSAGTFPGSMISFVSSGMWYDEIDILGIAPTELSNYSGYNIFTEYGNYLSWKNPYTGANVNPFTTNTFTPGSYRIGLTMPVMDWRVGVAGGFSFLQQDNLTIGGSNYGVWRNTQSNAPTAAGQPTYTESVSENYTDKELTYSTVASSGMDLDFLGVSTYFNLNTTKKDLGGAYTYSWEAGSTTAANDQLTSKTVYYGTGTNGAVAAYPTGTTTWLWYTNGELKPLNVIGFTVPVRGSLLLGSIPSNTPTYNPPMTVTVTTTNVTGASAATDTNSLSYTVGHTMNAGWDPTTASNEAVATGLSGGVTLTQAQYRTLLNNVYTNAGGAYPTALNVENYKNSNFETGFGLEADPNIKINSVLKARTRLSAGYTIAITDNTQAGFREISYRETNATANDSTFAYSQQITIPNKSTAHEISGEIGGIVEFTDPSGFVSIGVGLFYNPDIILASIDYSDNTTVETFSWQDRTGTDPVATAANTAADDIFPGTAQGSSIETTTTTYTGNGASNRYTHSFYIPVGTKIKLKKDKLYLIGGYTLKHEIQTVYTSTPSSTTTTTTQVYSSFDRSGDPVYDSSTAATPTNVSTTSASTESNTTTTWNGIMNFMLRWMLNKSMTVDFFGQGIMSALNFTIFGDNSAGVGFNPRNFVGNLGISISYHIPQE